MLYPKPTGFKVARQGEAGNSGYFQCSSMDSPMVRNCDEFTYRIIHFGLFKDYQRIFLTRRAVYS